MLLSYFLKRFYISFALYFAILTFLFAVINIFLRLHLIHSPSIIPLLAWSMLPVVTTFAFPFAATMAVCTQVSNLRQQQECLFIRISKRAQRAILCAVGLFSLSIALLYMPVVFYWAPYSYRQGKIMIANIAYQQISDLTPNKLHTPFPGAALYFKNREFTHKDPRLEHLFFSYTDKDEKQHIFTARYGLKKDNTFVLQNGAMVVGAFNQNNHVTFESCTLFLDQLIKKQSPSLYSQTKYLSISQLFANVWLDSKALLDFHKRIAQQVWQFLLPFFAFYFFFFITAHASALVWGILFSGISFFVMYLSFMLANLTWTYPGISILFFYFVPMLCLVVMQRASVHKR